MAAFTNIIDQIKALSAKNLILLLVAAAMSVTAVILLFTWSQKADFQLLYSNLSEEDAGAIVQKLNELKVPYKASQGGIMVPSDKVYDLRLQLAGQGLPQGGGVGFEVFDKTTFTMTDFVQKLNYRRAVQGELARTIRSLSEVEQARVHLAVPEKNLFTKEEDRPKASILVKLKPGRRLTQGQVQGVVHLVASSIEGLNPKDVAVVDSKGEMLTSPADDAGGITNSQAEYQRNIEKDMELRVASIIEPVVGKGKAKVKVAAAIDFTRIEKTEERFDPDGQVIRSEQKNIEKSSSGNTSGVPGTGSNLPGKSAASGTTTQGQSEKKNETTNYEISKITSHTVNSAGGVRKLSVVVLVDGTYTAQKDAKDSKYTPRSEEDLKKFEDMVKKTVGFTAERGDEVRVVNMPFEVVPQEEVAAPKKELMPVITSVAKFAVPAIGVLLLFLFVIKPLMKTVTAAPTMAQRLPLPQTVAEVEKAMEAGEKQAAQKPDKDHVLEWAKKNPKEASDLVKGWMEEK